MQQLFLTLKHTKNIIMKQIITNLIMVALTALPFMLMWNYAVVDVFAAKAINYIQAAILIELVCIPIDLALYAASARKNPA